MKIRTENSGTEHLLKGLPAFSAPTIVGGESAWALGGLWGRFQEPRQSFGLGEWDGEIVIEAIWHAETR